MSTQTRTTGSGSIVEEEQDEKSQGGSEAAAASGAQAGQGAVSAEPEASASGETTADADGNRESPAGEQTSDEIIAGLEAKLTEANDNYLRKAADFENFRKRMNQEKQSAIDFANQSLILDLIPVIDDFERAIKAAETQREAAGQDPEQISAGFGSLCEGIGMIEKRLVSQLENKWGLKRFDSAGEAFDPNRHEAIMMEKSAEIADPVVAEDFIKGYTLKDRVIRAAKVKVIMPENG